MAVAALGVLPPLFRMAHTDESGFLYLAGRVLDGQRHGLDFLEINPPLAIWLSMPPVLIHRMTGWHSWVIWVVMVAGMIAACLWLTARWLKLVEPSASRRVWFMLAAGFAGLLLPGQEFSEREHLAMALALPYLALAAARADRLRLSSRTAGITGVLAGVGFSLKPHFVVTWLLVEAWLLLRLRRETFRRVELPLVMATGGVYLALVFLVAPDYPPMILDLAPHYQAYLKNPLGTVVLMAGPALLLIGGVALAARHAATEPDGMRDVLSLGFLGYLLAGILQLKGLSYHYLAAAGIGFLLLVRVWQTRPARLSWQPSGITLRLGFGLIILMPLLTLRDAVRELLRPGSVRTEFDPAYPALLTRVQSLAAGKPIVVLSSNMNDGWPLTLDAGSSWASRYMHFWPMAAVYHDEILAHPLGVVQPRPYIERAGFERRFSDQLIEDLERYRPRLLVVVRPDSGEVYGGHARRFDYLGYFGSDPRFREMLEGYRELSPIGIYRLFLRDSTAADSSTRVPLSSRATVSRESPNRNGRGRSPVSRAFSESSTRRRSSLTGRGGIGSSRALLSGLSRLIPRSTSARGNSRLL
jgi:hypothetical protein